MHELGGGASTLNFGYRIMALRKNYEKVRFADHTHDLDGMKKMRDRMKAGVAVPHDPGRKPTLAPQASAQVSIHAVDSAY